MAQWIVFSVVALLTSNAVADILVQPGYGQPRSIVQSHSLIHPMAHPLPTIQQAPGKEDTQLQQASFDPGYHYELHPIYPGLHQAPGDTVMPYSLVQAHQLTPYLSRAAQRRLNSGKFGDFGVGVPVGLPAAVGPQYHYPLAVHSRHRRSIAEESTTGAKRDERDEIGVAAKSSLTEKVSPVVDLQSRGGEATKDLEEKHVGVRQSGNGQTSTDGILLGLKPSNMYPAVYEYRSVKTPPSNPAFNSPQQIASEQARPPTLSQINSRAAMQQQTPSQNQVATSAQTASFRANPANIHAVPDQPLLLQRQQSGILQNSVHHELRNFPDPRPVSSTPQSLTTGTLNGHSEAQTSTDAKYPEMDNDDRELVGAKFGSQNVFPSQQGRTFEAPRYASSGSYGCSCTNPGYVVYNDVPSNDLPVADASPQSVLQVYQVPSAQNAIYSPNANYLVSPQTYSNYATGYNLGYPSSTSPVRYCLQNLDTPPSVMYQFL